ncbi:MAG: glutamine amidotransferase-related protein, partial [Micromonosporaceae bacterium]
AFSVQYHPEAAAGPHDADYLFDQFVDLINGSGPPSAPPGRQAMPVAAPGGYLREGPKHA